MASNAVILWVLGGTGALLLYSAVKNQHPEKILLTSLQMGGNAAATSSVGNPAANEGNQGIVHAVADIPAANNTPQGYWRGTDKYGTQALYSGSGQIVGTVPTQYSQSPGTFIYRQDA